MEGICGVMNKSHHLTHHGKRNDLAFSLVEGPCVSACASSLLSYTTCSVMVHSFTTECHYCLTFTG